MRSSASLSSSTAPVSASTIRACLAWVSMPPTTVGGGVVKAFTLGSVLAGVAPFILAETSVEETGTASNAAATTAAAIGSQQRLLMGSSLRRNEGYSETTRAVG